jgi:hypothetical protein
MILLENKRTKGQKKQGSFVVDATRSDLTVVWFVCWETKMSSA